MKDNNSKLNIFQRIWLSLVNPFALNEPGEPTGPGNYNTFSNMRTFSSGLMTIFPSLRGDKKIYKILALIIIIIFMIPVVGLIIINVFNIS